MLCVQVVLTLAKGRPVVSPEDLEVVPRLVTNRNQRISFVGTRLAAVSARRSYAPRWAELELFRVWDRDGVSPCPSPAFVFTRIGRSRVYHVDHCPDAPSRLPFGHELAEPIELAELSPCPACSPSPPPDADRHDFRTTHRFEITRHRAVVCSDAVALAGELSPPSRVSPAPPMRLSELPWLSARLLSLAAVHDDYLAAEFRVRPSPARPDVPPVVSVSPSPGPGETGSVSPAVLALAGQVMTDVR
jgi:hypothetical protein